MSDEQLHSLDESDLVSQWKQEGEVISEADQAAALESLESTRQNTEGQTKEFNKMTPQVDEETAAKNRAKLLEELADEGAQQ